MWTPDPRDEPEIGISSSNKSPQSAIFRLESAPRFTKILFVVVRGLLSSNSGQLRMITLWIEPYPHQRRDAFTVVSKEYTKEHGSAKQLQFPRPNWSAAVWAGETAGGEDCAYRDRTVTICQAGVRTEPRSHLTRRLGRGCITKDNHSLDILKLSVKRQLEGRLPNKSIFSAT